MLATQEKCYSSCTHRVLSEQTDLQSDLAIKEPRCHTARVCTGLSMVDDQQQ